MAMQARLFVDGEFYNLKEFKYGFVNGANSNGFSSDKTRQVGLTCVIEAIRQELFEEWAMENYMKKYVEIHMEHTTIGHGKSRILKCHDTFLLEFYTRFSHISEDPITFYLFMKSGAIEASWSTADHVEQWSSLPEEGEVTVIDNEKKITDYYLTDKQNNEIDSYDVGDTIVLNIAIQNRVGDIMTINLNDNEHDFKQDGVDVVDDIIRDISIKSDLVQIELEVIAQKTTTA